MLKSVFFRRTGRGGGRGAIRSKLMPIGLWLQRRVLWLCGLTKAELESFETQQRQQHVPIEQVEEDDSIGEIELGYQSVFV